ncbi:TVP38/TMEM64 family protein [Granulosicoccus sp. 3-233]|uniref:TVP38/TMEM64 family protein n=1 Tax=Granulosicoccus sp. 3-233 TaxID=3417969 RepID=UPI003D354E3A
MTRLIRQSGRLPALIASILLLVIIVVVAASVPEDRIPARRWGLLLEAAGAYGIVVFLSVGTLATSIGLPRQLVAFIGGLAYGLLPGLALSLMAALSGCHLTVQVSRRLLRHRVERRYPAFIERLSRLLRHDTFVKVLILRLQPLGTNLLTNLCIGFTDVSYRKFLLASGIGYIPQMLVFVLLGAGVRVGEETQGLISGLLVLISVFLGVGLYLQHKQRQKKAILDSSD